MIVVVGLSFRTAPVEVRERFATSTDTFPQVLARLASRTELAEVMFLSTCNRVEVFARPKTTSEPDRALALRAIREVLGAHASVTDGELVRILYEREGQEAIRHIFRVAASLDSMVLGEPQILGQVKSAYDAAIAAGSLKSVLGRCVQRAFTTAKRVRSETALGAGTVSISSVAVDLAKSVFGDLQKHTVLLLGAGEMAEAAARSLGKGAKAIHVCNRSSSRGEQLAQEVGGTAVPWADMEQELGVADVVVASTGSPHFVVTRDMMKRVMKARRGRTLLLVDIAVPRNVDPEVHAIDNVFVFDIDDLEQQVALGLDARKGEAAHAEVIVEAELSELLKWAQALDVQPTVVALRAKTKGILVAELERSLQGRLKHLGETERAALLQMVESATNKLLHAPSTRLRTAASTENGGELVNAARTLFDLPEAKPDAEDDEAAEASASEPEHTVQ